MLIERDTAVLERLRSPQSSTTLLRNTNMFVLAVRPDSVGRYYAEHLIHRTPPSAQHPNGMEILEGPFEGLKGSKGYGIVEVKGNTFKLAYNTEKDNRPKDFDGKEGFAFEFTKHKDKPKE